MRKMSEKKRKSSKKKIEDDERSFSRASSIGDLASVLERNTEKYQIKPEYRDIKTSEIMKLYEPKWMAWMGVAASIVTSFSLPGFGFVLSQYTFVLAMDHNTEEEKEAYM